MENNIKEKADVMMEKIQADWNKETNKMIDKLEAHLDCELHHLRAVDEEPIDKDLAFELKTIKETNKYKMVIDNKSFKRLKKLPKKIFVVMNEWLMKIITDPNGSLLYGNNYKKYASKKQSVYFEGCHQMRTGDWRLLWEYSGGDLITIRFLGSKAEAIKLYKA